jgi:uncharacterized protein YecE (DUF72 family)
MASSGLVRIGISGWKYEPWRGVFYPEGLPQKQELTYAASNFSSLEINGTFYSLQRPEHFAQWYAQTPPNFVFAVKASRYITHMLRLKGINKAISNFFASGILRLGGKLGPILWQFPAQFRFDPDRLEPFLKMLPRSTLAAAALARKHDSRVTGRSFTVVHEDRPMRHAIEIRDTSFIVPEFIQLLRTYNVALVCADTVSWPRLMDVTADFVYCRLHGSKELYVSGYDDDALDGWAARVAAWARGNEPTDAERVIPHPAPKRASREVFVYFDNDAKVRAPFDAEGLTARVAKLLGDKASVEVVGSSFCARDGKRPYAIRLH